MALSVAMMKVMAFILLSVYRSNQSTTSNSQKYLVTAFIPPEMNPHSYKEGEMLVLDEAAAALACLFMFLVYTHRISSDKVTVIYCPHLYTVSKLT